MTPFDSRRLPNAHGSLRNPRLKAWALGLLVVVGCTGKPTPTTTTPQPYLGPTLAAPALIDALNAKAETLPTLWAAGQFEADFRTERDGRSDFVNGSVVVLHAKPANLRVVGTKSGIRAFDVGLNDEAYWALVKGATDTLWHGRLDGLDAVPPGVLPIRPDRLADVLGLGTFDADLLAEPFPVVRFNPDADAYMVIWHERRDDPTGGPRYVALREVWYDRATLVPRYVFVFDENGRIAVRGFLSDPRPVAETETMLPTNYDLLFPDTGSTMRLTLDRLKLTENRAPGRRTFVPPDPARPGVGNVVDLDAALRATGGGQ